MIRKLYTSIKNNINKSPVIKQKLVNILDFLFVFRRISVGNLRRGPAYLSHLLQSKKIAGPGMLSFKGGMFNPGALLTEQGILLVAKAQHIPWFKAKGNKRELFLKGNPVTFLLDQNTLKMVEKNIITDIVGFPQDLDYAIEDFRMFKWKEQSLVNHSFVIKGKVGDYINQTSVKSSLSLLSNQKLTWLGFPTLDFSTQNIEKNWVYKEDDQKLLLFYSLNPYHILFLENDTELRFKTLINQQFENKLKNPGSFGTMVSFSCNPIDFDDQYWLLIVHQIDNKISGRCYYHWAVLIDKKTLLPVKITKNYIFSGMGARGRDTGFRYISSILKVEDEILFFAGEGDVYITVTKKKVNEIIDKMISL